MEFSDYAMVGDIISLIPAGSADDIDPRYRPVLNLSGSVLRNDAKAFTFDLAPDQYVWMLRNWTGSRVNFPVRVFVRDSKRWGGKKPNPYPGSNVTLTGFLIGVTRNEQGAIEHFDVELEKVTYHGKGTATPANGSPGVNTPEKRKMKYTFDSTPTNKRRRFGLERNDSMASTSTTTGYAADSEATESNRASSP
ncbi:hypothetical protein CPB83DRAFT_86413 [Crepidotus variabilis]|uniref:Uncharacterized protein n=1 Tax=Crepidotus variabilis TaxID=179855 RepID=A0A9P6JTC5_9AGAR|nr:hypothetical protein CPB83DRAFT_86413 [Crepidotus variabilis]